MSYNIDDIYKIVEYKTWSQKRKIDTLLEMDAEMYCNMGLETPKTQKENTKRTSRKIYHAIKKIDPLVGSKLIQSMD